MRGRKKSTKEANAEYLQKQGGTEVAEQKKQQEQDLNQLLKVRREKLADLQANGKDPFKIVKYDVTHHSQEIKDHFDELESQTVTIAPYDVQTCNGKSFFLSCTGSGGKHPVLCGKRQPGRRSL